MRRGSRRDPRNGGALRALVLGAVAAGLALSGCRGSAESDTADSRGDGPPSDAAAMVTARNDSLLEAIRTDRLEAAMSFYAPDAILLPPDGRTIQGRDSIGAFWRSGTPFDSVSTGPIEVTAGARLISHVARYTLWTSTENGGVEELSGRLLIVWGLADDGTWRIVADMWH